MMRSIFETALEYVLFNPGVIDLVVWFPKLEWDEFAVAAAAVLTWSWLSERLWYALRWVAIHYGWRLIKRLARALIV